MRPNRIAAANRWPDSMSSSQHVYEVRPRKDNRGVDLISDASSFFSACSQVVFATKRNP
jgi:hypothetical protein